MASEKTLVLVRKIYNEVHAALWALAIVSALYALTIVVPRLPAARAEAEWRHAQDVMAENESCCAKLHMGPGTALHDQCMKNVGEFRQKVEQRMVEDSAF